jgi:hypothetical protein
MVPVGAGDEIGAWASLSRDLLAQGKVAEAREALSRGLKLADLRDFPLLALPMEVLEARISAAEARPGAMGKAGLTAAAHKLHAVSQRAAQLGLYRIQREAQLALGEVELRLNAGAARVQLARLAVEARGRGFELLARQAEQKVAGGNVTVAVSRPNR